MNKVTRACLAAGVFTLAAPVMAVPVVLDFEGVGSNANIDNFYNGGTDSEGNSGTDYGVEFSGNTLGIVDADAGGG
ncbi:MAG: hypothetical protein ACTHWH_16050, partial [Marinobacter sp.]